MEKYEFSEQQRSFIEQARIPFAIYQFIDKRVATLALSAGFLELFGYEDRAQAYFDMDNDMYKDAHPDDIARIEEAAFRFATQGGKYEAVYRSKSRTSSEYRIIHSTGVHVYADNGARLAQIWYTDEGVYIEDDNESDATQIPSLNIALRNEINQDCLAMANNYDLLTGLPSMSYFFELAEAGKKAMLERGFNPALLYLDLSGMKFFNMQNSFTAGDNLLKEFARTLKNTFSNENCCRIGSDHFAVFTHEEGLEDTLNHFFRDCREINGGNSLPVHIGIYLDRLEDVYVSLACDRAKFACDSLRNTYESGFAYYDRNLRDDLERQRYVLSNLDRAISEKWIQVHYQPIIRAVNGKICDEEALSRWIDPNLGWLSPGDFISALENAGVIYKLDLYVLEQVLEKMKLGAEAGLTTVPHSINLSRSDFVSCDIVEEVLRRVDAAGFSHDLITIEVTESTIGSDFEFMKAQVERFRELGFPVWMDDFGSGYSSLDLLQSMEFDLIKFDMSFMRRLDEGEGGKIVLTELMKMATALGADTVCEGVETKEQAQFLTEIGCSKLQGFYFCKAISFEEIVDKHKMGMHIGFENPEESSYYDAIGKMNLYDIAAIASEEDGGFRNYFDTLPMAIMEIGNQVEFVRSNQSYRDFIQRFFGFEIEGKTLSYPTDSLHQGSSFLSLVKRCCETKGRAFFDETMPDGSIVHSFARSIGANPVTNKHAAAIAVLSITEPNEGTTYAGIARALAADYYNIYYVDLDTERFIEYSSSVGGEELAMERHGEHFFESSKRDTMTRIFEDDRTQFLNSFTKENIIRELDRQGVFTATYRLIDTGEPVYVNMKITRMRPGANQIIMGISIIDSQMKHRELLGKMQQERDVLTRVMALSGDYLSMYSIDPETGRYFEYNVTSEFANLGYAKEGEDFFMQGAIDAQTAFYHEDVPGFLEWFKKDNVLNLVNEFGSCSYSYRLVMPDGLKPVSLRIAKVMESGGERLVAGVRPWKKRKSEDDFLGLG